MNVSSLSPVALPARTSEALPRDLEGACRALEKEFALLVFRKMREAMVPQSESSGFAQDSTYGLLDAQWAELASQGEGLGLWQALYRDLEGEPVKSGSAAAEK